MPLERHWERQNTALTRLSARERRMMGVVAATVALGALVIVVLAVATGAERVRPGCLRIDAPGTTGAYQLRPCGSAAITFCRTQGARHDAFAQRAQGACRRYRIPA